MIEKKHKGMNWKIFMPFKLISKIIQSKLLIFIFLFATSFYISVGNVLAVSKLEGGNITIESLGTIIKGLATKLQVFGIIASFIAIVIFVIQFIVGDDEAKQRKKKTILYTLAGVAFLILVPSVINFIIDTLE